MTRIRQLVASSAGLYLLFMGSYLLVRLLFGDSFWPLNLLNTFMLLLFVPVVPLFVLGLLVRSRQALLCLIPIALVLVVWFAPRFVPRSSPEGEQLRVLSNNVWHANRTPEAVVALVQGAQPDVVLLQEVSIYNNPLAALAADYPYRTAQADLIRAELYEANNVTLSRLPFVISEVIQLDLPLMPAIDRNVVEVAGQRVAFYNVHLAAPDGGLPRGGIGLHIYPVRAAFAFDDSEHNRQIDALLTHLANEPYPYIIAGDFNLSDLNATYNRLAAHMTDCFSAVGYGMGESWPAVEALGWAAWLPPFLRVDYIWSGSGLRAVRAWQGPFVGSDHLPLVADFVVD